MAYDTPYTQKDNSGSIFKNDKKEQESHPDGKGSALIDGVEYWVSSWNNVGKNGTQYRSLSFQRKDQVKQSPKQTAPAPRQAKSNAGGFADMDSDIPF
jgi:hypothetical protein